MQGQAKAKASLSTVQVSSAEFIVSNPRMMARINNASKQAVKQEVPAIKIISVRIIEICGA